MILEYLKRLLRDVFVYGLSNFFLRAIPFCLLPLYTRFFLPADYGALNIINVSLVVISYISSVGLSSSLIRFYNDYRAKEKKILLSTILWTQVITSFFITILLFLVADKISLFIFRSADYVKVIRVALLAVPFTVISWIPIDVMRMEFKKWNYFVLNTLNISVYTILAILFVVRMKLGIYGPVLANCISAIVVAIFGIFLTHKYISIKFSATLFKSSLLLSIPIIPAMLGQWTSSSIDRYLLAKFSTLSEVGIYSVAISIVSVLSFTYSSIQLGWSPIAYSIYQQNHAKNIFKKFLTYLVLIFVILSSILITFGKDIVTFLTPVSYISAHRIIGLVTIAITFDVIFYMVSMRLIFAKKTILYALSYIIGAIANILLNLFLIPKYGAIGAGVSMAIAYGVTAYIAYYWGNKYYFIPFEIIKVVTMLLCLVVMYVFSLAFHTYPVKLIILFFNIPLAWCVLEYNEKIVLKKYMLRFLKIGM